MRTKRTHDPILWSTIAIAILVAVTAIAGIWWPATYARETLYTRAGAIGSDLVDLFLVVPVLLMSGIMGSRGSAAARLVWLGSLGYLFYNFVLYAFGVHFNALFLVYCATLSLCFYAAIFGAPFLAPEQIAEVYGSRAPRKTIAIVFLALALCSAIFDLLEDVSALLAGRTPPSVVLANTPVNFVHALDLVFLLPALCIAAYLLLRRRAWGYALAPAMLTVLAIMDVELAVLMVVMARMGCFPMFYPMIVSFAALGVGCAILLWLYFSLGKGPRSRGLTNKARPIPL